MVHWFSRLNFQTHYHISTFAHLHAIIDLKYIPKARFTEKLLQEKTGEAKEQLARYRTSEELMQVPNLLKFVVVFKGDECVSAEDIAL